MKTTTAESQTAFTITELFAILAIMGFWICVLVPALASTRSTGRTTQCLNNVRQLVSAWKMYADDNAGRLPGNPNGGNLPAPGWIRGDWLTWGLESDNTNTLKLQNGLLGPYTKGAIKIYRCPAADFLSPAQRVAGWKERVRSTSMNGFIEGGLYLNPSGGADWYNDHLRYDKLSDIVRPSPKDLWVFADEHPDSIDDPWFITDPTSTAHFVNFPASYHNGAGNFAFADSHVEVHKWKESSTIVPVTYQAIYDLPTGGELRDITWMQQHSTAHRKLAVMSY